METREKALLGLGLGLLDSERKLRCGGTRVADNRHVAAVLGAALVVREAVAGGLGVVAWRAARLRRRGGAGLRAASTRARRLSAATEESFSASVDGTVRLRARAHDGDGVAAR
jgi:hypothetical protein